MTENWTSSGTKRDIWGCFLDDWSAWNIEHYITLRLCWQITGSAASRDSRRTCCSSIKPHDCSLIASAGRRRVCSVTYDLLPPPSLFSARINVLYEAHYYRTKLLKQVQPVWAPRISADRIKTKWLSHVRSKRSAETETLFWFLCQKASTLRLPVGLWVNISFTSRDTKVSVISDWLNNTLRNTERPRYELIT